MTNNKELGDTSIYLKIQQIKEHNNNVFCTWQV